LTLTLVLLIAPTDGRVIFTLHHGTDTPKRSTYCVVQRPSSYRPFPAGGVGEPAADDQPDDQPGARLRHRMTPASPSKGQRLW
jgi:hypothetical protein